MIANEMRSLLYLRNTFLKLSQFCVPKYDSAILSFRYNRTLTFVNTFKFKSWSNKSSLALSCNENNHIVNTFRTYSKKKKSKKGVVEEEEEESDADDDESFETLEDDVSGDNYNVVSKSIPSMRIDTVAKAAFGVTKKKVEKEFYANNLRVNGITILKKSLSVGEGNEVDIVKGLSPDNDRFLLVDRVIIKSIGKITGAGNYPVKFQVFKGLTIENYSDPWVKSTPNDPD